MDVAQTANEEQIALWNGVAGQAWVDCQTVLDRMFQPLEDLLLEPIGSNTASKLLDVGCGTGSTTLSAAKWLGPEGRAVGIDISEPMIELARDRAKRENSSAEFICADAQTCRFQPQAFDMIVSRIGVMFFDNFIEAFSNLLHASRSDAELRVLTWRSAEENPFMTAAERASAPLVPEKFKRKKAATGQFALSDRNLIQNILLECGWDNPEIQPVDFPCTLPEKDLHPYLSRLGPLGRILPDLDERSRKQITETIRPAFDPYIDGADVRFTAACWLITARAARSVVANV